MYRGSSLSPARTACAVLGVIAALLPIALAAQEGSFEGNTEVHLVEVPVEVSLNDEPVRGLTADDFEIYEGKMRRPIESFEVVDLTEIEAETGAPAERSDGPTELPSLPVAARRHFLLFFDLAFSEPAGVVRAQEAALELIREQLHPSDLAGMGVYTHSGGARLLLNFTSDRRQLELAIETLGLPQLLDRNPDMLGIVLGEALYTQRQLHSVTGATKDSGGIGQSAGVDAIVELLRELERQERTARKSQQRAWVSIYHQSFTSMAELLGRIDARKYVMLFSEGYDAGLVVADNPDDYTTRSVEHGEVWQVDSDEMFGNSRTQNELEGMIEELRRGGVMVHAVDVGGLRASGSDAGTAGGFGDAPGEAAPRLASGGRDALFAIADGTGGSFYENFNDLGAAVGRVIERSSVTYLLTFRVENNPQDGSYHPIEVRVKNLPRRAKVLHRDGYHFRLPGSFGTEVERKLELAAKLMDQKAGPIASALVAMPVAASNERSWVPYVLQADGADLLAGHRQSLLSLDVSIYAFDAEGSVAAYENQLVVSDLEKMRDGLSATGLRFYGDLELPSGRYQLRALVRNQHSDAYGVASAAVTVPEAGAPPAAAALFVERPGEWVMLRESPEKLLAAYPFVVGDTMVVPAPAPSLSGAGGGQLWLRWPVGAPAPTARITTPDGRAVSEPSLLVVGRQPDPSGGAELLLANLTAPELPPGEYLLHLAETAAGAGEGSAVAPMAFRVVGEE